MLVERVNHQSLAARLLIVRKTSSAIFEWSSSLIIPFSPRNSAILSTKINTTTTTTTINININIIINIIIMAKQQSSMKKRGQKRVVVFNPEARASYLRGFSERKRQRRAYGLAMQKVKDRKAKIEERAESKKEQLEQVEQAEQQKAAMLQEALKNAKPSDDVDNDVESIIDNDSSNNNNSDDESESHHHEPKKAVTTTELDTKTYDDQETESHWGGRVTVTTSVVDLDASDTSDDESVLAGKQNKKEGDVQQRYAGKVDKFLSELKGKMPAKKRKDINVKRKGKNGAAEMKGMGGAGALKMAQRVLSQAKQKMGSQGKKQTRGKRTKR